MALAKLIVVVVFLGAAILCVVKLQRYTKQITSARLVHKQQPHAATYNKKHDNNHRPDGNYDVTQSRQYASMLSFLSLLTYLLLTLYSSRPYVQLSERLS